MGQKAAKYRFAVLYPASQNPSLCRSRSKMSITQQGRSYFGAIRFPPLSRKGKPHECNEIFELVVSFCRLTHSARAKLLTRRIALDAAETATSTYLVLMATCDEC